MQLSRTRPVASALFDDPNLVSCAGLVPVAVLAQRCGLAELAGRHLSVPTDKGAHAGAKVSAVVAGMVAGVDSIVDMALLRHGAMGTVFARPYAPSTLGSFLREFRFGHVRQLDAVASRLLVGLHDATPLLAGIDGPAMVDIDDTIIGPHSESRHRRHRRARLDSDRVHRCRLRRHDRAVDLPRRGRRDRACSGQRTHWPWPPRRRMTCQRRAPRWPAESSAGTSPKCPAATSHSRSIWPGAAEIGRNSMKRSATAPSVVSPPGCARWQKTSVLVGRRHRDVE